jgi:hypothetical protein
MLNFPNAPSSGQVFNEWIWDGVKWVANTEEIPPDSLIDLSDVQLTSPQTNDVLMYDASLGMWTNHRPRYNIGCFVPGTLGTNQTLLLHKFAKDITFPANFGTYLGQLSEASAGTAATASDVIWLEKALSATPTTFASIGTVTFAAGANAGTFASVGGFIQQAARGDVLRVRAPASADATLGDFFMTLVGYES